MGPGTRGGGGDLEGFDFFALELGGLPEVVGVLHLEPDVGGLAEGLTDTNGHLGGDLARQLSTRERLTRETPRYAANAVMVVGTFSSASLRIPPGCGGSYISMICPLCAMNLRTLISY